MSTSDKIALAALIVSIAAAAFAFFSPWLHAWLFDRPKLTVDAHFEECLTAKGHERTINVTISNVGRRPLGIRHVGLILSEEAPTYDPAADNPKRQGPAETADDAKIRMGDASIYFDPSSENLKRQGPAETACEGNIRVGDMTRYFDPSRD